MAFEMSEIVWTAGTLAQNMKKMAVCYEHGNKLSGSIRCREFLHKLSNC